MTSQTPRNILLKEPIMATQTRRTTRRSAKFFSATIKASMVTACCGLVLWSAVTAHASQSWNGNPYNGLYVNGQGSNGLDWNGAPLNGLPVNGVGPNGTPIQGMPRNGVPMQGMPMNGVPLNGTPMNGLPAQEDSRPTVPPDRLPWHSLSHQGIAKPTP
jgi:hypothetical protein